MKVGDTIEVKYGGELLIGKIVRFRNPASRYFKLSGGLNVFVRTKKVNLVCRESELKVSSDKTG